MSGASQVGPHVTSVTSGGCDTRGRVAQRLTNRDASRMGEITSRGTVLTDLEQTMPPPVDAEHGLLRTMVLIRRFEEKCVELYHAQTIGGFLHLYIGEEAVATGVMDVLGAEDAVVATHRDHGHALARGVEPASIMSEMFGKVDGCSRGRGGSMHLFDAGTNFFGGNAIVGAGLPVAAGLALADRLAGTSAITTVFFGEGAVTEGEFHETMNLASLWDLPVLFCCENNRYAMGTAIERAQAGPDLSRKAAAYGIAARPVDGMDVMAVREAAGEAAESIRKGRGPRLLEFATYRYRAHSMYDPELYRDKQEIAEWRRRDPIERLRAAMTAKGSIDAATYRDLVAGVDAEIEACVVAAAAAPVEPVADLERFVYSEGPA